jgi:MoaA/NifB/PqqE/SkfB family radical SAM enzyme
MTLTGLHLLLTYQCNFECDHCFVWGGPEQSGTMTLPTIRRILEQADDLGTVEWIYFEGGEAFLYYPVLAAGVRMASERGYRVGIVTNAYWATDEEDAFEWLRPFAGLVQDLSISRDAYHGDDEDRIAARAERARSVATRLGIPVELISIAKLEARSCEPAVGQLPGGESGVMFRGRAAEKLAPLAASKPWEEFTECPWENLREPERVHIDPFGHVHLCQGLSIGNLKRKPLRRICRDYLPRAHPVVGALLGGGPAELARRHGLPDRREYADACHLCYEVRRLLRDRYPETLTPAQMYGAR